MVVAWAAAHDDPVLHGENRDAVAAGIENMLLGATAVGLATYWSTGAAASDPGINAAAAGLYFLLDPTTLRRNFAYLAWVYAATALLMAFWLVPLIVGLPYATSIHWEWQFQSWMDIVPPILFGPRMLIGSFSSASMISPSPSVSSAWPIRPSSIGRRMRSLAPSTEV